MSPILREYGAEFILNPGLAPCMEEAFSVFLLAFSVGLILNYFESRMHPNESRPGIEYDFGLPMHPNGPESDYFTLGQLSL